MDILSLLEFNEIRTKVSAFTKTELGQSYALTLEPFKTEEAAKSALALVSEASALLFRYGNLPLSPSHNLAPLLEEAKRGNILTPHDFYLISADTLNIIKLNEYLKDKLEAMPLIKGMLKREVDLKDLNDSITKVISPNLLVKDSASHALNRIRKNISNTEDKLKRAADGLISKYSAYLAETLVTKRDGHFVIPIKTTYKNKVDGIIFDISNSGQTIFIEPSEVAALNSTLISYQNDEIIEENRILRELTLEVLKYEAAILNNNILLAELDFIFAKASYGNKIEGFVPTFQKEIGLSFKAARHPLIDPELVVANSFNLRDDKFIIIISGPNAGGKTVALKTIGLLVLMAKSGLMLPVSTTPSLYFYQNVYASIGDEQSLSNNLSTFSSHIARVASILEVSTCRDLVLLDELGTGTSPEEGEALALAITSNLLERKVSSVISSHYSRLKEFAYSRSGIINASMAFDEAKLSPKYEYKEDVPGRSYGLVVAKRFGIKDDIIKNAQSFLSDGVYDFEMTIGKLRSEISALQDKETILEEKRAEMKKKEQELDKKIKALEKAQTQFNETKKERLEKEVKEALDNLDTLVKSALKSGGKAHEIIEIREEVRKLQEEDEVVTQESDTEDFKIGGYVEMKNLGFKGEIVKIKDTEVTLVLESGKTLTSDINNLKSAVRSTTKPKSTVTVKSFDADLGNVKPEINLIGMRVEEALNALDAYLDRALLKHYASVRVIHGFGTGALRRAIHEHLKALPFVKSFSLGGEKEGHGGVTIVNFK